MTTKEELREEFFKEHVLLESRIFSNKLYFKTISTPEDVFDFFWTKIEQIRKEDMERVEITEDTSDGYHTFKELYEFRKIYNAVLFNYWASNYKIGAPIIYDVHKSKKHSDGQECFGGGWFIVVAELPTGQISNHYELKDWDLFQIPEKEMANKFDGHTPHDVTERLLSIIKQAHE